jgi:hypothetical protein
MHAYEVSERADSHPCHTRKQARHLAGDFGPGLICSASGLSSEGGVVACAGGKAVLEGVGVG